MESGSRMRSFSTFKTGSLGAAPEAIELSLVPEEKTNKAVNRISGMVDNEHL